MAVSVPPATAAAGASTVAGPVVRVDQIGYPTHGSKVAYLMSPTPLTGAAFSVRTADNSVVYSGVVGADSGKWNATYPYVYPMAFSPLTTPGTDHLSVAGTTAVTSPAFRIGAPATLWSTALHHSLTFYQNERDGPDYIPSKLRTAPGHLNDEHAMTYSTPKTNDNGQFAGNLSPLGVTIDASGGWWDAGDYLKFVETTSYAVALLAVGARTFPDQMGADAGASNFLDEIQFGIEWLEKMWNDSTKTLYYQVGIGEGNSKTTGDHDIWRLPQADDTYGGHQSGRSLHPQPAGVRSGAPGVADQPQPGRSTGGGFRTVRPALRGAPTPPLPRPACATGRTSMRWPTRRPPASS